LIRNHGRHCAAVSWERVIRLKAASVSAGNFLMYGAGGGGEYIFIFTEYASSSGHYLKKHVYTQK